LFGGGDGEGAAKAKAKATATATATTSVGVCCRGVTGAVGDLEQALVCGERV